MQFLKIIMKMLRVSLGQRLVSIDYLTEPSFLSWAVNQKMPKHGNIGIGLKINLEHAFNVIDKGPVANLPEVSVKFARRFYIFE